VGCKTRIRIQDVLILVNHVPEQSLLWCVRCYWPLILNMYIFQWKELDVRWMFRSADVKCVVWESGVCMPALWKCFRDKFHFKGAVSSIFSVTVKSQKTHFYLWKPKKIFMLLFYSSVIRKKRGEGQSYSRHGIFQYMETIMNMSG